MDKKTKSTLGKISQLKKVQEAEQKAERERQMKMMQKLIDVTEKIMKMLAEEDAITLEEFELIPKFLSNACNGIIDESEESKNWVKSKEKLYARTLKEIYDGKNGKVSVPQVL